MLEILISKQVDIYIAIVTSIFGAVLGLFLGKVFAGEAPESVNSSHTTTVVTISKITKYSAQVKSNGNQDPGSVALIGGFLMFLGLTTYCFFRTAILQGLLYSEIFLFSIWVGAVLRSLSVGSFKGFSWVIYLIYVVIFMIAYFIAIALATNPITHPVNFYYAEMVINKYGWSGMTKIFSQDDIPWAMAHLAGILLLLFTFWNMAMSLINILATGSNISSGQGESWLMRKTAAYCAPWRNMLSLSLFLFLGGAMVSGVFLEWLQHDLPLLVEKTVHTIMYGRQ